MMSMAHAIIVQKHHGTIDVRSTPGAGATFVITLPAPAAGSTADGVDDLERGTSPGPSAVGKSCTEVAT